MKRPRSEKGAKTWRYVVTGLIALATGVPAILTDNVPLGFVTAGIVLASILSGPWVDPRLIDGDSSG